MEYAKLLSEQILASKKAHMAQKIRKSESAPYFYASHIHPCDFFMTATLLYGECAPSYDEELQFIFCAGQDEELRIKRYFAEWGIDVFESQSKFRLRNDEGEIFIAGSIDGKCPVKDKDGNTLKNKDGSSVFVLIEIKSMNMNSYLGIKTSNDFYKTELYKRYLEQMNLYLGANGCSEGLFVLSDFQALKTVAVKFDEEKYNATLVRLKKLFAMTRNKKSGDCIPYCEKTCPKCKFRYICGQETINKGAQLVSDEDLINDIRAMEELRDNAKTFQDLKDSVNARLKTYEGKELFVGKDFYVKKTEYLRASFEMKEANIIKFKIQKIGEEE
jgi:CRISPR/Cas system-associated exonuclease Cas4 (RecB family)